MNFRVYWDGDLKDELFDRSEITKWNPSRGRAETLINLKNYGDATDCAVVKYTPNIQADLFGDWREEIILWDRSDSATPGALHHHNPTQDCIPTPHARPRLPHGHRPAET